MWLVVLICSLPVAQALLKMALPNIVQQTSAVAKKVVVRCEMVDASARGCLVLIEQFIEKIIAKELPQTSIFACKLNCSTIYSILQHLFLD